MVRRRGYGAVTTTLTKVVTAKDFAVYMVPEATGMADYLDEGESRIRWAGAGAAAVGLGGSATAETLGRLLAGEDPKTVQNPVGGEVVSHARRKVMGYEWSYVPPKSVSALWAVSAAETRRQIEEAADAATAEALAQVEEAAAWTRQRRGGRLVRLPTEGLLALVVPHTSSRDGDPHLHHHVVVANQARRLADNKWCAVDARGIYGVLAWSGTVWGMTLRAELVERLGVEWEPISADGRAPELLGIPAELLARWSQRAAEIEAETKRRKKKGLADGNQIVARDTRKTKDLVETREEKHTRWVVEAMALGHPADRLVADATAREGSSSQTAKPVGVEELAEKVAERLDEQLVAWDRIEWLTTAAELSKGTVAVEELLAAADVELSAKGLWAVRLPADTEGGAIGGRWTTTMTLARERGVLERAVRMAQPALTFIDVWEVDRACDERGLDPEQTKAVWDIALSGRRFSTLAAPAGTGKTTTMGALAAGLSRYGIKARALAVSQNATDGLGDALGIGKEDEGRRQNITRFLMSDSADDGGEEWWVIDEASMVGSRDWDKLLDRAEDAGATVVAVGDPYQVESIGPGGLFRTMVDHPDVPTADLQTVWRLAAEWEKEASLRLRDRDPEVVDAYLQQGRIRDHDDLEELLDGLAAARRDGEDVLVIATSNRRV